MKNILFYFIAFVGIGLINTSCTKEWLKIDQPGVQTVESFYSNDKECLQATTAIYAQIQRQYASTDYVSPRLLRTIPSDMINAGGGDVGDQAWLQQVNLYINTSSTPNMQDVWRAYYYSIYRANLVVDNVDPSVNANRQAMVGEAYAIRAYLYFELVNMFGDVPIVLSEQTPDEYLVAKSTKAEVYDQIRADLVEAINLLPVTQITKWRVGKGFAQTMLAKSYMFQDKDYPEALSLLETVINSGQYFLEPYFDDATHIKGEWGTESMFELGFKTDNPYGNGFIWNPDDAESSINMVLCGPRDFVGALTDYRGGVGISKSYRVDL